MRWPWQNTPASPPPAPPATLNERLETFESRLEELQDRYNRLTRRFDRMQGEFSALNRQSIDEDEFDEEGLPL